MTLKYFAHGAANLGMEREALEDCVRVEHLPQGGLIAIVCDGMGGAEGGAIAARTATRSLVDAFRAHTAAAEPGALKAALHAAHAAVVSAAQKTGIKGMGTTAVVAWCENDACHVGWVGDSRMYLWRRGQLVRRTMDHSRVAERIARGELTPEEGAAHPDAHKLSQALGVAPALAPSVFDPPMQLATGDVVLLCSDGLYDMVDETEMCALIEGRGYAEAVPALIEEANRRGGHDNIGVAIVVAGERRIKQSNGGAR